MVLALSGGCSCRRWAPPDFLQGVLRPENIGDKHERRTVMTSILKALLVALTLVAGSVAAAGSAVAGAGSPYPDNFKNPPPSVGVGSEIPRKYRLGR